MATTTSTDLAGQIETRVSMMLTQTLIQESVMMGAVRDYSSDATAGVGSIDISLFNELAVQDVVENGAMTGQVINPTEASLALNRNKAIPFAISRRAGQQSKVDSVSEALRNGARSLAAEIDDFLLGLIDAGTSTAGPDHRLALSAGDPLADIRNAKKLLDDQNVPKQDRFIVASPGFVAELLSTNNLIRVNEYGSANPIQAGFVSDIYGFRVLESSSSSVIDDGFHAFHRGAVAFARQIMPELVTQDMAYEQERRYVLSHLYGGVYTDAAGIRSVVYDADGA